MLLKGKDGIVAELVRWNLSTSEQSYALVKLSNGGLSEWRINDCFIVEEHKTSEGNGAIDNGPATHQAQK